MTARTAGGAHFVGRVAELAELRHALADAQAGHGRMTLLSGDAGMGKTRLAEELARQASAAGIPVVWGRCSADSGAPPLWPLRRIAEQLPGQRGRLPTADSDAFGSSAEDSAAARFTQFVWVADAVVQAAQAKGLVVIVEDLHWADSATAAALGHLAAEVRRSRALVIVTTRPSAESESGAAVASLDRASVEQRQLSGLDRNEISEYLAAVAGGPVDQRYADLVFRQTAGNSLFVGAVARLLHESVSLHSFDLVRAQSALTGRPELLVLIREPIGRVSIECRDILDWASVAGEEFGIVELSAALGVPPDTLTAFIDEAVATGLLTRPADAPGTARFVHALVRQGVYDNVERTRRATAHRAWARAISASDGRLERIAVVAGHLARGASTPAEHLLGASAAREAGNAALTDFAYAEAAGQYRSALYSLSMAGGASPTERAEILLDLALAEYRSGAFGGSLEHCTQAADLAEIEQRWDLLARAALLVDGVSLAGDSVESLCRRALDLLPEAQLSIRAQLQSRLAYAAAEAGDLQGAADMSAQALALAEGTADAAAVIAALRARHQALAGPGYAGERLRLGARAIELGGSGEPLGALWGRLWRVDAAFELGDLAVVDQELSALALLVEELRFPLARWHHLRLRAAREALVGRFDHAEDLARAAHDLARDLEDPSVVALYYAFQLSLCYVRGDSLLDRGLDDDLRGFLAVSANVPLPIVHTSVAMFLICAGEAEEAARMARSLTGEADAWPLDARWLVTVAMLANVVADVQDQECAERLYPLLEPFSRLSIAGGAGTVECEGSVSRPLGRLAATCGRFDVAERHLSEAVTFEEHMGARPFAAISRMYLAQVLQTRGGDQDLPAATRLGRVALAAMQTMDMPGRVAECKEVLAAIDAQVSNGTSLTPREREIVVLVAEGLPNREIAETLFVSERTVETHVSHVLAKLRASSRKDIASWAVSLGLTGPAAKEPR